MKDNYSKFYPIILTKEKGIPKFWSRYVNIHTYISKIALILG